MDRKPNVGQLEASEKKIEGALLKLVKDTVPERTKKLYNKEREFSNPKSGLVLLLFYIQKTAQPKNVDERCSIYMALDHKVDLC